MTPRMTKLALVGASCLFCAQVAHARLIEDWPYEKLNKYSDLVVIAEAVRVKRTKDTLSAPQWKEIEWGGRNTILKVKCVIKGKPESDRITVLHFRIDKIKGNLLINGPLLASFKKKREYMLFLKRRSDGRFELVSGQIDPVLAIREMSLPFHMALDEK